MVKKVITEEQLRAANKAGYSTQQIAGEINKYEKTTGNDAVYSGNLPNGQAANPGLAPAPAQTPVQTQPIVQKPNPDMIDTSTGKPASESPENTQYNILPESVTGVKPYISPTLQAKIDAKKTPVTPVQPTPAPVTTEEVVTPVVEPVKPVETKPVEVAPVLTDVEKQAQATGVKYAMVNGLPEYEPTNKEEALKILQSGGKFSAENGMTAVAKANLDKYRKYAQMTDTQLAQNIVNGNVSSRELEQITSINPDLVAKAKDMARKSTITDTANTIQVANDSIVKGEDTQVQNKALTNLLTKLADLDANAESYGDIKARVYANYPDMEVARGEIVNAQTQLRQLQRAKRDLFDDYRKKNSDLPISMIMAGYSALSKGIDDQIYEVNDTLSQNVALYNSYLDEAKSEIDWEVGNQAKQEQRLFDMYGVTNAAEIRQEDLIRKDAELQASMEQAQSEQEYNMFKDERDYNLKVAETKMKAGQWEAEYGLKSAEYDLKTKQAQIDAQKGNWSVKDGQLINADTGEIKPMQSAVTSQGLATPMVQNLLDQCRLEGQCGEGANDYLQKLGTGRLLGDSYKSKTEDINSPTPVVGSVAVWNPSGDNIGHAGIVLEDRGDKVLIRDWNYGLDEKQQEHEVPKNTISASGGGYIVPDKLKEMRIPEVQKTILDGIENLENHPGLNAAVGFGWQKLLPGNQAEDGFLPASDAEDFRVQFASFRDNIVLPNLELLKGAMSDNDIKFIRSAGTAASLGMSEEAFRGELNRIKNKIYEKFGMEKRAYSQREESLIKDLAQAGATDAEIDEALNKFRS